MEVKTQRGEYVEQTNPLQMSMMRTEREKSGLLAKIRAAKLESLNNKLILDTFDTVPDDRRCYRMTGKILVERKVSEVKPAIFMLKKKADEDTQVLQKELDQLEKEQEMIKKRIEFISKATAK